MIWKENLQRLQLKEYLDHSYEYAKKYENAGILIEDLNEDDCLAAVMEMENRLQNRWITKEDDNELQNIIDNL